MDDLTRISNESAMLFATSAAWSPEDQQLVCAQVPYTSPELFKAVKASLSVNNGKQWITIRPPADSGVFVKSAKRGFITVGASMASAHAQGYVGVMLHPLTGNPQETTDNHFYLVICEGDDQSRLFIDRLNLAVPWPVRLEWAEYLFNEGMQRGIVEPLPMTGSDFKAALRVSRDETAWEQVISDGLQSGQISIH